MPNGARGDDIYCDIAVHKVQVFSRTADRLIQQLRFLMDTNEFDELLGQLVAVNRNSRLEVVRLESLLAWRKTKLLRRAKERGWDVVRLKEAMDAVG